MYQEMGIYKVIRRILIFVLFLSFLFVFVYGEEKVGRVNEESFQENRGSLLDMAKNAFFVSTRFPVTKDYWVKVKALLNQAQTYLTPPNLDFRKSGEAAGAEGRGEKMKEAVVNSFDKSKATIEDSAKTAAKIAGETAKKVKHSLSEHDKEDEAEL